MSSRKSSASDSPRPIQPLNLPPEYEDLEGLIQADLKAVVTVLTCRAHERMLLTRREHKDLQHALWNRLAEALSKTMEPLSVEAR